MDDPLQALHRRVWDAIPWVVNGSAAAAERELVLSHSARCDDCRDELAFQQRLHAGFGVETVVANDAAPGLERLWARIDAGAQPVPPTQAQPVLSTQPLPAASPARHASRWTRLLVAAVVVQAIGLVALLGVVRQPTPPGAGAPALYETLSRAQASPGAATLRFVPAPSLSMAELQTLLARSRTRIVETSADGGVFGLASTDDAPGASGRALAALRAASGVLLVEPVGAAAAKSGP